MSLWSDALHPQCSRWKFYFNHYHWCKRIIMHVSWRSADWLSLYNVLLWLGTTAGQLEITENGNGNENGKEEKVVKYSSSLALVELRVAVVNNKAYMTVTQNHQWKLTRPCVELSVEANRTYDPTACIFLPTAEDVPLVMARQHDWRWPNEIE